MDTDARQKVSRLVTRLGIRDAAALRRIHPALAARVAEDGDAQLNKIRTRYPGDHTVEHGSVANRPMAFLIIQPRTRSLEL